MNKTTPTGRTPREPNMQNIPIRTPEGKAIREAFVKRVSVDDIFANGGRFM